jgi:HEAT repeat protein
MAKSVAFLILLSVACGPPPGARKAQQHLASGDYVAANEAADRAIAANPDDATSRRIKIRALMAQGNLLQARQAYSEWHQNRGEHDREALQMMAKSVLWQALQVPAEEVAAEAVQIVERHEIEELADPVRELVVHDSDLIAAAASIAVLRSHPNAPRAAVGLLRSEDARARALVVRGIGRKVGARARKDIRPLLKDRDPRVRLAVATALSSFHSGEDDSDLIALAKDEDGRTRAAALRGLTHESHEAPLDLFLEHLGDEYLAARLAAVAAVAKRAGVEAASHLRPLASGSDMALALAALRHLREPELAEATLARALESAQWTERVAALNAALEVLGKQNALRVAGRALLDGRIEVRLAAARLLWRLGVEKRAREELHKALQASSADVRLQAAADLALRGDGEGLKLLNDMAASGTDERRLAATRAHIPAQRLTSGLISALTADNIKLRLAAADVLLRVD